MADIEDEDEGSWTGVFAGKFKSRAGTDARLVAERKAGLTPKQRAAARKDKTPKKKQVNFRASSDTLVRLEALKNLLKKDATGIIELAIEELAKAKREVEGS